MPSRRAQAGATLPAFVRRDGVRRKKESRERLGQRVLAGGLRARRRRRVTDVRGSAKTRQSGGARAGRDAVHSARVVALRARARAEFLR